MNEIQRKLLALSTDPNYQKMTLREIAAAIGVNHAQSVRYHLSQLQKKGFVKGESSSIEANDTSAELIYLPIVGAANCGPAMSFAEESIEGYLPVSPSVIGNSRKENFCVIRAVGDSMNQASINGKAINNGDYVIIDTTKTSPQDGDYVLSVIDGFGNIKRFVSQGDNGIALLSESLSEYHPIYIHNDDYESFSINGTVYDVINR